MGLEKSERRALPHGAPAGLGQRASARRLGATTDEDAERKYHNLTPHDKQLQVFCNHKHLVRPVGWVTHTEIVTKERVLVRPEPGETVLLVCPVCRVLYEVEGQALNDRLARRTKRDESGRVLETNKRSENIVNLGRAVGRVRRP